MSRRKTIIPNAFLNEYVYSCLYNVTNEQKKGLSKETLRIISTAARAKGFAANSTIDEKLIVLTELGLNFSFIIMPNTVELAIELKRMMVDVQEQRLAEGLHSIVKSNVFITTDKQTKFYLGLASMGISHTNYFMNQDLIKTGHYLKKWGKRVNNRVNEEIVDAIDSADLLDGIIEESVTLIKNSEGMFGLLERDLLILFYLRRNQHLFVSKDKIALHFKGAILGTGITTSLKKLNDAFYIRKGASDKPTYTITATGIDLVSRFRNRVLSASEQKK